MFRENISSRIEIAASPERVWAVLTDLERYPEWNPFIRRISGRLEQGARMEVAIKPPGKKEAVFKPTLTSVVPNRKVQWLGRLGLPKIFDGEHTLAIEPVGTDRTRFVQSERFNGLLVPFTGGALAATQRGFQQMNEALKKRAESGG